MLLIGCEMVDKGFEGLVRFHAGFRASGSRVAGCESRFSFWGSVIQGGVVLHGARNGGPGTLQLPTYASDNVS